MITLYTHLFAYTKKSDMAVFSGHSPLQTIPYIKDTAKNQTFILLRNLGIQFLHSVFVASYDDLVEVYKDFVSTTGQTLALYY